MKKYIRFAFIGFFSLIFLHCYSQSRKKIASAFLDSLMNEQYDYSLSLMDSVSNKEIKESGLPVLQLGKKVFKMKFGNLKYIDTLSTLPEHPDSSFVKILAHFHRKKILFKISFDSLNKITGFFVDEKLRKKKEINYSLPNYYDPKLFHEDTGSFISNGFLLKYGYISPDTFKKYPVVIFIHGSGPNDMDESIGPNKIFKDIAIGLAKYHISTFRYDKRSFSYPESKKDSSTIYDETVDDALNAIEFVKCLPNIDTTSIFFLGHSLGAYVAPYLLNRRPKIKGALMLGYPSLDMTEVLKFQIYSFVKNLDKKMAPEDDQFYKEAIAKLNNINNRNFNEATPKDSLIFFSSRYWLSILNYNHNDEARQIQQPVFLLYGSKDDQVNPQNYEFAKKSLEGKKNITISIYNGLNHVFLKTHYQKGEDDYEYPAHVPKYVIKDMAKWIKK